MPTYKRVPSPIPTPYMTEAQAAAYLGLSPGYLAQLRVSGKGPEYRDHGRIVYHLESLEAWSAPRRRRSTSDVTTVADVAEELTFIPTAERTR